MSNNRIVPGIEAYPDLSRRLSQKVAEMGPNCGDCSTAKLATDFRKRLQARLERDKWLKKP